MEFNDIFTNRFNLYSITFAFILLVTILIKLMIDSKKIEPEAGRKLLHFFAVLTCGLVVYHSDYNVELSLIFIVCAVILAYIAHRNLFFVNERNSYGIAFFPFAFALLLAMPFAKTSIVFGIVTLGISDAAAGLIGHFYAKTKIQFLYESKSWLGFMVFFGCTMCIALYFAGWSCAVIVIALIPALAELFSFRGSDNLTIPIAAAFSFEMLSRQPVSNEVWWTLCIIAIVFYFSYLKKWLSITGTTAALLLASLIVISASIEYLIPIGLFFVIGSLTSKLHPKAKDASGRNAFQVFANGLMATLCLVAAAVTKNELLFWAYFASVAISLADTISSDIGLYFKHKTYDIWGFTPMQPGLSGGISVVGTLAGLASAILFAAVIMKIFGLTIMITIMIASAGIAGMIIDSLIGSLWQAKYLHQRVLTEEKNPGELPVKGKYWLNNDGVNLISNLIGTLLFMVVCDIWLT